MALTATSRCMILHPIVMVAFSLSLQGMEGMNSSITFLSVSLKLFHCSWMVAFGTWYVASFSCMPSQLALLYTSLVVCFCFVVSANVFMSTNTVL